jgi:hypothetical protein
MVSRIKRAALAGSVGLSLTALPVRVADPSGSVVRLNDACGQATECFYASNFICSTFHKDWQDYRCTKGCIKDGE